MGVQKARILVVDDEDFNLEILTERLEEAGYDVVAAEDGVKAWAQIERTPHGFDAVLLDRMMPNMDGMELLAKIKARPDLKMLPVILQTAKAAKHEILEGLEAGAYYYLTKPFDNATMLAIVKTAVGDHQNYCALQADAKRVFGPISLLNRGCFEFKTLKEAWELAALLSKATPKAAKVVGGLSELMVNAVEHGNLGITYREKGELIEHDAWKDEVERRLTLPENVDKVATVTFERKEDEITFLIKDEGEGFEWEPYLVVSHERAFDNHGRGITMARVLSFDYLEFQGNGNQVLAVVSL